MKIVVLNGSPKGLDGFTGYYLQKMRKLFPDCQFVIFEIGKIINILEHNKALFKEIIEEISSGDGIIWASPVYIALVPSQYKKFIELVFSGESKNAFEKKFSATILVSIHFFDSLAGDYLHAVSDDLNMNYVGCFSLGSKDFRSAERMRNFRIFIGNFIKSIEEGFYLPKLYPVIEAFNFRYNCGQPIIKVSLNHKKAVILKDCSDQNGNLSVMVDVLSKCFDGQIQIISISDLGIKNGCRGCFDCAYDGRCFYDPIDHFSDFYRKTIEPADIVVFAGKIIDRNISANWRMYFDRMFFKNHRPTLSGKQFGFIVSGRLSQAQNLRQFIESYGEIQGANLAGIITDESADSVLITNAIFKLARDLVDFSDQKYTPSPTFWGVGGNKIIMELIFKARAALRADYAFFRHQICFNSLYRQNKVKQRFCDFVFMLLIRIPIFRERVYFRRAVKSLVKPQKQ